ncbi:MAG: cell wall-binding repeat-containing protein [Candidatus Andersenbacteria bacterium]
MRYRRLAAVSLLVLSLPFVQQIFTAPTAARAAAQTAGGAPAGFTSSRAEQDQLNAHKQFAHTVEQPSSLNTGPSAQSVTPSTATAHKVYGFHPYWMNGSEADYRWSALSTLVFFKLQVKFDGYLDTSNPNYAAPAGLVDLAHANGVRVEYAMTSTDVSANNALLTSKTYYTRAADALVAKVVAEDADGINVDLELIQSSNRAALTDFIKTLTSKMHAAKSGSTVTIDIPAIDWTSAFDIAALAANSDGLIMMGYDYWGCWSDTAGPIAPLYDTSWRANYSVQKSVQTYLAELGSAGPDKLILGVPWYGGSWETSGSSVPKSVSPSCSGGGDWLGPLLFTEAEEEAALHNKNWYAPSQVPYTTAAAGQQFQTWYDDAQSLVNKYNFADAQDLGGVAVWALGYEDGDKAMWDGLSAYGQGVPDSLKRLFGSNRYETAIAISQEQFPTAHSAKGVVLATGENWPDALGGAVLARWYAEGPLLLTASNDITPATATEIDRVLARDQGKRVFILGGTSAVSQEVTNDLEGLGFTVVRVAGNNRFETAATIATLVGSKHDNIFMGTGANFPDILSAAGPATERGEQILLTSKDSIPQATLDFLDGPIGNTVKGIFLIGGESVISQAVADQLSARGINVKRIAGEDRYETSQKVAEKFYPRADNVALATGTNFADGLAGANLAADTTAPIVLVQPENLPQPIWDYLEQHASTIVDGFIYGGTAAVSRAVQNVAQTLIAP